MAITNRLITGRFTVAVSDGADGDQVFDNPHLSGVVVQFIPQPNFIVDSGVTTFLTTIEGVTDSTGHLKSSDGQIGVPLPVCDPAEGVMVYKVHVIPPDGSQLHPYRSEIPIPPGSGSLDISDLVDWVLSPAKYPAGIVAGLGPPQPRHAGSAYFDLTDVTSEGVMFWLPERPITW